MQIIFKLYRFEKAILIPFFNNKLLIKFIYCINLCYNFSCNFLNKQSVEVVHVNTLNGTLKYLTEIQEPDHSLPGNKISDRKISYDFENQDVASYDVKVSKRYL